MKDLVYGLGKNELRSPHGRVVAGSSDYDVGTGVAFSTDRQRDKGALAPLWSCCDAGRDTASNRTSHHG